MKEYSVKEVTDIVVSPQCNTPFNIDGEIFPVDDLRIQSMPGALTLIGSPYLVPEKWAKVGLAKLQ